MEFAMDFAEALAGDVGVEFGGGDAGVAEEFLDDAEVSAVFEEVGGEGVAEHVGCDVARNAGVAGAGFDAAPHGRGAERGPAFGEEKDAGRFWVDVFGAAGGEVTINGGDGVAADGDDAFFVAFADDGEEAGVEVEIFKAKGAQFGESKAAGVSDFEDGLIAKGVGSFGLKGREEAADFVVGKSFGKAFPAARKAEVFSDVGGEVALGFAEFKKGAESGDLEVKAAGGEFCFGSGGLAFEGALLFVEEVRGEVFEFDFGPALDVLGVGPGDEALEGGGVGFLGLFSAAAFVAEGLQEIFEGVVHGV
jgi:hypothetical protein